MYKSFSSELLWFPGRSLKDDVPLAAKYKYEGISFDIKRESAVFSAESFSSLLAEHGLRPASFALPVEFRKEKETFDTGIKALPALCEFAQRTGTTRCTAYIMPFSDTLDYKTNFLQHKKRLRAAAEILEEYGIRFGLEFISPPLFRKGRAYEFIHNLDGVSDLLDAIGTSNLGHLLDVFHWDMAGQIFDDFKKIQGNEQIIVAHINDAPKGFSREEQPNHQRELPGATGVLRINDFIKGLRELNYDGPVLVEPFNESLRNQNFEDAVKAAKAAMDKVL